MTTLSEDRETRRCALKRLCATAAFLCLAAAVGAAHPGSPAPPRPEGPAQGVYELVVVHTNDHHGHPLPFSQPPDAAAGGLPARLTIVRAIREKHQNVLLLDAGDMHTGMPESDEFQGEPDLAGYDVLGYDAVAIGNHEFDIPLEAFEKQCREARFPFLSANIRKRGGGRLGVPYVIKQFPGFRVAVFGLTLRETSSIGGPDIVKNLVFEDEVKTARRLVKELRKRADVVVALVHLGLGRKPDEGSRRLAKMVPGIDLVVDGHSHTDLRAPVVEGGTPIVQALHSGLRVGVCVLAVGGAKVRLDSWAYRDVNWGGSDPAPQDPALVGLLRPYGEKAEKALGEVLGRAEAPFPRKRNRGGESAIGNFMADSMLWYARGAMGLRADFAMTNSGGVRSGLPEGPVTMRMMYEVMPFQNRLVVIRVRGKDLSRLFRFFGREGNSTDFPHCSANVLIRPLTGSETAFEVLVDGKPIRDKDYYLLATNSYLASGGENYPIGHFDKVAESPGYIRDVMAEAVKVEGSIRPVLDGRVKGRPRPVKEEKKGVRDGKPQARAGGVWAVLTQVA